MRGVWGAMGCVFVTGCAAHSGETKVSSREVCVLHTEPGPGLPRLYRRANAQSLTLGPGRNLCTVARGARAEGDRCEDVDDLSALLGTGKACGPGGVEKQLVCPAYARERLSRETPELSAPVCSGGCENVQIAVREASGTVTRVLFYDDPLCHTDADPDCPGAEHACYYRVLALTSELR